MVELQGRRAGAAEHSVSKLNGISVDGLVSMLREDDVEQEALRGALDTTGASEALLLGRLDCGVCGSAMSYARSRAGRAGYVCACSGRLIPCADLDVTVLGLLYVRRHAIDPRADVVVSMADEPRVIAEWVSRVRVDAIDLSPRITWADGY